MKNKINTLIAIAVALGVVWLWNTGFFNSTPSINSISQPIGGSQDINISGSGLESQVIPELE